VGRLVAPEEFWVQLWAGVNVVGASRAVGVSHWTGYRWLAEVGGPAALGLEWTGFGRPWGGRKSEEVRDVFWAELRRGRRSRRPPGSPAWRDAPGRPG
jgi:hypothetical protein